MHAQTTLDVQRFRPTICETHLCRGAWVERLAEERPPDAAKQAEAEALNRAKMLRPTSKLLSIVGEVRGDAAAMRGW
ncbi:MAG: hypothetical protein CL927_01360 [Deltaproteobacteria bacterium]|nr:hypothetical protein [Deltaproteobacteria bacterium]